MNRKRQNEHRGHHDSGAKGVTMGRYRRSGLIVVASPSAGGASLLIATVAFADSLAFSNTTGGSFSLYGQLSPLYLGFDDGAKRYADIADNDISNSRIGFHLGQDLGGAAKVQLHFETNIGLRWTF
jgi:hypothetical protein